VRNSGFLRQIIHTNGNALTNFLGAFGKYSAPSSLSFQVFGTWGAVTVFLPPLSPLPVTDLIHYIYKCRLYTPSS